MDFPGDQRSNVLGVGISPLTISQAAEKVFAAADECGFSGYVTVTGVHGVMESQHDEELKRIHNRSFLDSGRDADGLDGAVERIQFLRASLRTGPDA